MSRIFYVILTWATFSAHVFFVSVGVFGKFLCIRFSRRIHD